MSVSEYTQAVNERRYVRSKVTRIFTVVSSDIDSLNEIRRRDYIKKLHDLREELKIVNSKVFQNLNECDDKELDDLLQGEEEYDYKITLALATLDPMVESNNNNSVHNSSSVVNLSSANKLKLPTIDLPTFSNEKTECLEQFFHAFESVLDKHNLSDYEKFMYLKGQVHKSPKSLINSLDSTEQSYKAAKKLLNDAFASPLTQRYKTIEKLSQLKMHLNTDVYEFISEVRNIISSIKIMSIDVDIIVQYFVWSALNDRFQNQLIQITNSTKPDLGQILDNYFSATERYLKVKERISEQKNKSNNSSPKRNEYYNDSQVKTTNFAVKVSNSVKPFNPCPICFSSDKNTNHLLRNCKTYPNPIDKVNKLKELKFCSKCSFINHETKDCRFKFGSLCKICSGNHLSYLCIENQNTHKGVMSKVSAVHFNSAVDNEDVVLPTFTLDVIGVDANTNCKILSDTGSQRNFVSNKIARALNLQVVKDNVDIIVHGFNSSKEVKTKIVKFNVIVDDNDMSFEAIVIPYLDMKMNVRELADVRMKLDTLGYQIADSTLGSDHCIDLVMGPDSIKLLSPHSMPLIENSHSNSTSVFSTKLGIMLLGNIRDISNDLDELI